MIVIVPPSDGKVKIRKPLPVKFKETDFPLMEGVEQIISLLSLIHENDLKSVYGTSKEKALKYHRQNQDALNSRVWPAIDRYTGVVYEHIGWPTLSLSSRDYMEEHMRILSGLFGVVTPQTLVPDYKLKMNVLSVQYHWKPIISELFKDEELIIDLLPQVHRKTYNPPKKNTIEIEFVVMNKGKKTTAGHYGKAVKGEFIRYMAENNVKFVDEFEGFKYEGFKWDGKMFVKIED